ncbi:MAG: hypothetical protein ABIO24_05465 [Saprospiraceae bacterium]
MKNYHCFSSGYCALLFWGAYFLFPAPVFPQKMEQDYSNPSPPGQIIFTTKLSEAVTQLIGTDTAHSVGLFYRLDKINTIESSSYFWSSIIYANSDTTKEIGQDTLNLPNGDYNLTVYQVRKGGPIKTANSKFNIADTTNFNQFPRINLGNSDLGLFNSWNFSTETFLDGINNTNPSHFTEYASLIPDENISWVFVTLVRNNWNVGSIDLTFPDYLSYEGAIYKNCAIPEGNTGNCINGLDLGIQSFPSSGTSSISIQKNSATLKNQFVVHLIFKRKDNFPNPPIVGFGVNYIINRPEQREIRLHNDFNFTVYPKPHDPNCLAVDKKELCECGTDEYLTYRIDYQNDGAAPTEAVTVTLFNTPHLMESTIQHEQYTRGCNVSINPTGTLRSGPNQFIIVYPASNKLPGLRQNSTLYPKVPADACSDYFYIKVKKENCLSAGIILQPKAQIVFAGTKDTIYTNLDETRIVSKINCKACPPNPACPRCPQKKRCWLRDLFIRKRE